MDHDNKKPIKNRETPGYGYDKSLDDLKVIGKNREAPKHKAPVGEDRKIQLE